MPGAPKKMLVIFYLIGKIGPWSWSEVKKEGGGGKIGLISSFIVNFL